MASTYSILNDTDGTLYWKDTDAGAYVNLPLDAFADLHQGLLKNNFQCLLPQARSVSPKKTLSLARQVACVWVSKLGEIRVAYKNVFSGAGHGDDRQYTAKEIGFGYNQ